MRRFIVLILTSLLLLAVQAQGATTYYAVPDIYNPAMPPAPVSSGVTYIVAKAGAWPTSKADCISGVSSIQALWTASANGDAIVLSGGVSGVTYTGTAIDTDSWLTSAKTNTTIRAADPSDPSYLSHNGPPTLAVNGANRLFTNNQTGTVIKGIGWHSPTGAGSVYVGYLSQDITFDSCPFENNGGVGFWSIGGANVTFLGCTYRGTANLGVISMTSGSLRIFNNPGETWDTSNITTQVVFNLTGGTSVDIGGPEGCMLTNTCPEFRGSNSNAVIGYSGVTNTTNNMFTISGIATQKIQDVKITRAGYYTVKSNNATNELKIRRNEIAESNYHAVFAENAGTGEDSEVNDNYIHDLQGADNSNYKSCGIRFGAGVVNTWVLRNRVILPYANGIDLGDSAVSGNSVFFNTIFGGLLPNCHGLNAQSGAHDNWFGYNHVTKRTGIDKGQLFSWTIGTTHAKNYFDHNIGILTGGQDANLVYGSYVPDGSASVTSSTSLANWKSIVAAQSAAGWFSDLSGAGAAGTHDVYGWQYQGVLGF